MYIACCVSLSFLVEGQEVILRSRHSWHNVARFPVKFNRFSQGGYHLEVIEIENGIYCIFFIKRTFLLTWNFMDCLKTTFLFPIIVYYVQLYMGGGGGHLRWKSKERIAKTFYLLFGLIKHLFVLYLPHSAWRELSLLRSTRCHHWPGRAANTRVLQGRPSYSETSSG